MKIQFFGAVREVTGSRHVIEVNGKRIMLDCGLFQGHREESDAKNHDMTGIDPAKIDAVILSHAHIDHSGGLPYLVKNGFKGPIYSTFATRDLCNYMLMDSAYIQQKDAEYMNKRLQKKNKGKKPIEPLYTMEDAQQALTQFRGIGYEQAFTVEEGVICSFYDAGHILGSSLVHLIVYEKEKNLRYTFGFTGDLGRKGLPILRDPQMMPETEYLVTEHTYGDRLHEDISHIDTDLESVIKRTAKRGGKILIPAFSVERTQEIVYHLNILWQQKRIPDMPVFVDSPLSANVTEVFRNHPECFDKETFMEFIEHAKNPFGFGRLQYTRSVEESKALNELKGPAIIIASSGMCENGRILHHLKNNIEDPKNTIMIVGFMAEGTLGRKIKEKQQIVNIFGEPYNLRAEVAVMDAFSGHADKNDLIDYISKIEGLKRIFLVHGEEEQGIKFRNLLLEKGYKDVILPTKGQVYDIP
jgi:metallo-beta-lactamase family protein